jgi:hypothetical protein
MRRRSGAKLEMVGRKALHPRLKEGRREGKFVHSVRRDGDEIKSCVIKTPPKALSEIMGVP